MPQKLVLIRRDGEPVGETGYSTLPSACAALRGFSDGSKIVQIDAAGKVTKLISHQECKDALRSPIIRSK